MTLDGTRSTGDAPITCTWTFEDQSGSTLWEPPVDGCTLQKTFRVPGTKYVRLTVTDADGDTAAAKQSFNVDGSTATPVPTPNPIPTPSPTPTPTPTPTATPSPTPTPAPTPTPPPTPTPTPNDTPATAAWTAPSDAETGTPVTLDGTRSTGDAPITCTWTFEDQSGSTLWEPPVDGCTLQKTFRFPGPKYVTLTVTDADGDADATTQSFSVSGQRLRVMMSSPFALDASDAWSGFRVP